MLKIFGHPMSTCTRKVLMTLAETQTPHEFVTIDFTTGEHKKERHLARQPFGQVPAMDDDGFGLYESRAICKYINEKVGGHLVPKDLKGRALLEQWASVETSNFTPHAMKFIYHDIFKRPQDEATLATAKQGVEKALGVMEATLAKTPYVVGSELSLADIFFLPYIEYGMATPLKETFARYPHVSAWWTRASERPTWRKAAGRA